MPPRITAIAGRHLTDPVEIRVARRPVAGRRARRASGRPPTSCRASTSWRRSAACSTWKPRPSALVFCRTRTEVDELTEALAPAAIAPEALHGGMSQEQRDRVMRLFRAGTADLLIATDVAARGLDIEQLSHVDQLPRPLLRTEAYVHRIGRVGRAGREGVAITLAEPREQRLLRNIERATGQRIEMARVPTVADLRRATAGTHPARLA